MGAFSPEALKKGQLARKRNAKLRAQGKLPPVARAKQKREGTSIPLDSPIFDLPDKRPYKKTKVTNNRDLLVRVLTLLEKLV